MEINLKTYSHKCSQLEKLFGRSHRFHSKDEMFLAWKNLVKDTYDKKAEIFEFQKVRQTNSIND